MKKDYALLSLKFLKAGSNAKGKFFKWSSIWGAKVKVCGAKFSAATINKDLLWARSFLHK